MVSFCAEIFLLCLAVVVLTFFIAGLLFICAFEHLDNFGAYTASRPETGLLIPSGFNSYFRILRRLDSVLCNAPSEIHYLPHVLGGVDFQYGEQSSVR